MQQLFAGFPLPTPDAVGGVIQSASGSGSQACSGGDTPVTISGLDFTPDLIILYGEAYISAVNYKFSASVYTGAKLTAWNNVGWGNGQPCFRLATTMGTNAFTFTLYTSSAGTINYWWRAFKLE